ncbi:polysaccharide deacetylase family protein [Candidatus Gottesmanbacteria bacterium]|nr:polysaccharide deacetylase family protein [Candidatus Gottesmanbacteria bacterium]
MKNFLSIDFESWAYPDLLEFRNLSSRERKKLDAGFVKESAEKILKILAKYDVKLTFFVLGQLYEWYPETIEKIAQAGHELGFHTYSHDILRSKDVLIKSLELSKKFLQKFHPKGFRAPNILMENEYFPILKKYGFEYDSSAYGLRSTKKVVDGILEIPVSVYGPLPIGSGYFVGLLRERIGWFYQQLNKKNLPVVAFLHSWQIVKPQKTTFPSRAYLLTHPIYLPYQRDCLPIFEYLLANFEFGKMENLLKVGKND